MRIATFNVQNLRLRERDGEFLLDGARDGDEDEPEDDAKARALDAADRELTAELIARSEADVVALQEVFDQRTLDHFHDHLLVPRGAVYPHRVCLEGNDGRSVDVAILSRRALDSVHSHAALTFADVGGDRPPGAQADDRVFRRDCLALRCGGIHLFVCHLKLAAPADVAGRAVRRAEARAVRQVIEGTVGDPAASRWLALGDFNTHDEADEEDIAELAEGFAVDLCDRLTPGERWTYHDRASGGCTRPDRILASPALAGPNPDARPEILRMGLGRGASAYAGERLDGVGEWRPHASDHGLLLVELDL